MVLDSIVVWILSGILEEYEIPLEPFKFCFEIVFFTLFSILNIIVSFISYIFFPPEPKSVEGKVVLITGTARGNGRELAMQFHRLGARVVCVDRDREGNDETVRRIRDEGGEAMGFTVDVADKSRLPEMHSTVERRMGPVDVLVNNAGLVETMLLADPEADGIISDMIETNLKGQIWIIREILPSMLKRNSGHIVTITSLTPLRGLNGLAIYTATKCALKGMMTCLTQELKSMNSDVITTTVCPYFISNCPERSARRLLRFPEIPVEKACEKIIDGILRNERIVVVPSFCYYILSLIQILPEGLQNMFDDIVYTKILHTPDEEKILDTYTIFEEMSNPQSPMLVPCMKMGCLSD